VVARIRKEIYLYVSVCSYTPAGSLHQPSHFYFSFSLPLCLSAHVHTVGQRQQESRRLSNNTCICERVRCSSGALCSFRKNPRL